MTRKARGLRSTGTQGPAAREQKGITKVRAIQVLRFLILFSGDKSLGHASYHPCFRKHVGVFRLGPISCYLLDKEVLALRHGLKISSCVVGQNPRSNVRIVGISNRSTPILRNHVCRLREVGSTGRSCGSKDLEVKILLLTVEASLVHRRQKILTAREAATLR